MTTTAGAGKIEVSKRGLYLISGYARWENDSNGSYRQLFVTRKNGASGTLNLLNDVHHAPVAGAVQTFSAVAPMDTDDDIVIEAAQDSANPVDLETYVTVVRISG